jgi:formylglycine-generating enzyme required for sulfatase activity
MRHDSKIPALTATLWVATAGAILGATSCRTPRADGPSTGKAIEAPAEPVHDRPTPIPAGPAPAAEGGHSAAKSAPERAPGSPARLEPFEVLVPGTTTAKLALVPIPGGEFVREDGTRVPLETFFAATTEITWDMYDAFVFAMERAEMERDPPDAFARPSKPYILMDRGFGHTGYPVISVSFRGATEFCRWLSNRTGKRFRLPTEAEWAHAARGGSDAALDTAALDAGALDTAALGATAWYRANSKTRGRATTKPVGKKAANGYGLFDVHGNAAEWTVGADGGGVLRGGSFKDAAEELGARRPADPAWNQTDPQIPKSVWWLADGPFAGFRVACDP